MMGSLGLKGNNLRRVDLACITFQKFFFLALAFKFYMSD